MDIRKWLDETVLPQQSQALPDQLGLPPFLQPKEDIQERPTGRKRHRKRGTSDSSILDTHPQRRTDPPLEYESEAEQASTCSVASIPSRHSSPTNSSSHPYARRPRRKTRLERYDPKPERAKGRKKQVSGREKRESRISRRKSGSRPEQLGTGRVQNFQAKNVPQDRLTLRPREKLGIFNQGRASSPVRRRGLPDLVFSEMKFLQKQANEPEAPRQQGPAPKQRKRHHSKAKQEEISAYFTSTRPALAERSANIQSNRPTENRSPLRDFDAQQQRSTVIDNAIPSIEAPDKSRYLGFGSRGPRHESGSYISWSESVRSPSVVGRKTSNPMKVHQHSSVPSERDRVEVATEHVQPSLTADPNLTYASGKGFDWPSSNLANPLTSRSLSYPAESHSAHNQSSIHPSSLKQRGGTGVPPSTAPASMGYRHGHHSTHYQKGILDRTEVGQRPGHPNMQQNQSQPEKQEEATQQPNFGNIEPQLSTLGRLLRECDSVFKEMKRRDDGGDVHNKGPDERRGFEDQGINRTDRNSTYIMPLESQMQSPAINSHRPRLPDLCRPSIYEEQARRWNAMEDEQEDEPYMWNRDGMDMHIEPHCEEAMWYDGEPEGLPGEVHYGDLVDEVVNIGARRGVKPDEDNFDSVDEVVRPGFWRPHRLY